MADSSLTYFTCTLGQAAATKNVASSNAKTINDFLESQAQLYPRLPAVGFPVPVPNKGEWSSEVFSFEDLCNGSKTVAKELYPYINAGNIGNPSCVALLCSSSIDLLFTWLALMRIGTSVLLIAPQCQPAAIASLCKSCDASILFHDPSHNDLASSSASPPDSDFVAQLFPWKSVEKDIISIIRVNNETNFDFVPLYEPSENDTAYIHHSSGTSTGIPKPIPQSHRAAFGVLPHLDGQKSATFTTTPLYHGGIADCFRAWTSNALIWLFPGETLPITPKNIILSLSAASRAETEASTPPVKYFSSVPYVLQTLAEEPAGMALLQNMELVGVGGAALSPNIGDHLVSQGVSLVSRFGSAECGFLLSSHRDYAVDADWQFLRLPSECKSLCFEKMGEENSVLKELVVKKGWPHLAKTNRSDGSYATGDVFEPHPHIKNAWKYHNRSDSQITLLTGKKFDPAPFEDAICSSSNIVRDVVIFGNERQYPGALVFLCRSTGENKEEESWNVISKHNDKVEIHGRIDRNMIVWISADELKPEKSSKGTILRGPTEERFAAYIDDLYEGTNQLPLTSNVPDSEVGSVTASIVHEVIGFELKDDEDFYQHGVDSTKATKIRSKLQIELHCRGISYTTVGTFKKIANPRSEIREMQDLVAQYSHFDSPTAEKQNAIPKTSIAVLTGATGGLGVNILEILLSNHSFSQIICLVRAKDEQEAFIKVTANLTARKLSLPAPDRLKCVPFILSRADLGLSGEVLEVIRREAGCFIHPASSAPLLHPHPPSPELLSHSPHHSDTLGYSRSKWVAESICASASRIPSMRGRVNVVRVGQLTGDARNGVWNINEAWPLLLSTVKILNCLPDIKGQKLDWLPLDVAARAVVDVALTLGYKSGFQSGIGIGAGAGDEERERVEGEDIVYHVLNASPTQDWGDLLTWLSRISTEEFEVVDPGNWLRKLRGLEGEHPAKKLLWLWERGFGDGDAKEEGGDMKGKGGMEVVFSTERAMGVSRVLREFDGVDEGLVGEDLGVARGGDEGGF
ncbi:Adenylate-forming reductase [Lachnellula hyalina]|uniref:Adenylate-forming reductase n=1 Tax=Lachnellula hyalina TaxID=1316788 RepID=A0A8H8R7K4_9HELO|nr:Adenylate-forming reductase [Lachnellula hyalina]TVY30049.1 Adenylate-forming reductase [Lachnellula hyalina]